MPPRDERKTTVVIVENHGERSYVQENEQKQTVSMAVRILFMLCPFERL